MNSWFLSLSDGEGNAYNAPCSASYSALSLSLDVGFFNGMPIGMTLRRIDK